MLNGRYSKSKHGDDYQTPPEAVLPLLPLIPKNWTIWEPSCGQGNIVSALKEHGYNVIATDIMTGHDFLTYEPTNHYDIIVTNPPYSIKDQFIERIYQLNKPFALLMPLYCLESQRRQKFWKQGITMIVFSKRIDYTRPDGGYSSAAFMSAWFTNLQTPDAPVKVTFC